MEFGVFSAEPKYPDHVFRDLLILLSVVVRYTRYHCLRTDVAVLFNMTAGLPLTMVALPRYAGTCSGMMASHEPGKCIALALGCGKMNG